MGKRDLIHLDWDFCTGNGTQNIKWEWEFCFNPQSKKDFFRIKFKQKSNNSVMEFYPIKKKKKVNHDDKIVRLVPAFLLSLLVL